MERKTRLGLASVIFVIILFQYGGHVTQGVVLAEGSSPLVTAPHIASVRDMTGVALLAGATAYLLMTDGPRGAVEDRVGLALAGISLLLGIAAAVTAADGALFAFVLSLLTIWAVVGVRTALRRPAATP